MAPAKTKPALLGGVAIGVLSALPFIWIANCCCAWILFGGALAAFLMQQNHPEPIDIGDGAIVGLLAGIAGAFIWLLVSIPIDLAMAPIQSQIAQRALENAANVAPELRGMLEQVNTGPSIAGKVFGFFVMLVLGAVFSMLGGLFGALLFRKSPPPVIPPPIPPSSPQTF